MLISWFCLCVKYVSDSISVVCPLTLLASGPGVTDFSSRRTIYSGLDKWLHRLFVVPCGSARFLINIYKVRIRMKYPWRESQFSEARYCTTSVFSLWEFAPLSESTYMPLYIFHNYYIRYSMKCNTPALSTSIHTRNTIIKHCF